jgi:hypothetical protein
VIAYVGFVPLEEILTSATGRRRRLAAGPRLADAAPAPTAARRV